MKLRNKRTGEIGYLIAGRSSDHYIVTNDEWESCGEYNSLAELNDEWEDYEEPKAYWYIDDAGVMQVDQILSSKINMRKSIGNYFETREEAEKAVDKLIAWKRLKDKDFQFHGHNALGVGEITFSLDFEDMDDGGEIGQLRHDLDLLFGGEDD